MTATGDSGNGITHGALAGVLISDLILGRHNPWTELYDPARVRLRSLPEWTRENIVTQAQYADWLTGGEVGSPAEIEPGGGAVIRRGLRKLAVYRDHENRLFTCSARCPHLGAVVSWNSTEGTWDCPAHGSRFDAHGRVINGPACDDLQAIAMEMDDAAPEADADEPTAASTRSEHREGLPLQ